MLFRLAAVLIVLGFGSAILHFSGFQFRALLWAEPAQPVLGLVLGVAGTALLVVRTSVVRKAKQASAQQQSWGAAPQGPVRQPIQQPIQTPPVAMGSGGPARPAVPPQGWPQRGPQQPAQTTPVHPQPPYGHPQQGYPGYDQRGR
ncbi:hypothetical protein ABZ863_30845 [Saccharomonospora sp. NPDC046836]|uniref:hypothetical protein n=1 Tax=Saccharomonospora sp. NPDC046836 TaxID=3156921 RepID=UPI0033CA8B18